MDTTPHDPHRRASRLRRRATLVALMLASAAVALFLVGAVLILT